MPVWNVAASSAWESNHRHGSMRRTLPRCDLRLTVRRHATQMVSVEQRARVRRVCACVQQTVLSFVLFAGISLTLLTGAASAQNPGTPWPAADALGRSLPLADDVGPPREGRFVGIFYFLWLNERNNKSWQGDHPFDISKILAADPDALKKANSPLWGTMGRAHYWGEPLYGYYLSDDAWVMRRHAQLLADAGVDTLIFDTTNAVTYKRVYLKLCEVFTAIRKEGGRTPQIAFMVNTRAGATAQEIYHDLYESGLYRELWFHWRGKPLMICDPKEASDELRAFFTLRRAHWPFTMENTEGAWHWEATYPQPFGYADDPNVPEQVNVSVAQNLGAYGPHSVQNMSSGKARGRDFHDGKQDPSAGAIAEGRNFAEQWRRAYELDPPFVIVTGWNEWIAGRFERPGEPVAFVDQYDQRYSRDIEPVKGLHGDNFYYQLIAGIRRYKGAPALPKASAAKTIDIAKGFEQWADVGPEFTDHVRDTAPRDHAGAAGLHYKDASGRHDFVAMKVARDAGNVYFYARTREPLGAGAMPERMWLLIDADQNAATGWEGFDVIIRHSAERQSVVIEQAIIRHSAERQSVVAEQNTGGWRWETVGAARARAGGNEVQLAVPRNALGGGASFDFKWVDNLQRPGDVTDFYLSGDVAPEGRMRFRYIGKD